MHNHCQLKEWQWCLASNVISTQWFLINVRSFRCTHFPMLSVFHCQICVWFGCMLHDQRLVSEWNKNQEQGTPSPICIYRMCLLTGKPRVPTNTKQWVRLQETQPLAQPLVIWARSASQLWSGNNSSKPSSLPWHFSVWLVTVYWLCSHQFTKPSQLLFNFPPLHVLLQPVQGT